MIAPEFRGIDNISLQQPCKTYVSFNYGDGLWDDLQSGMIQTEQSYNMLSAAPQHKTNPAQLEKYQDLFLQNYRTMNSFSKYFVFGNSSVSRDARRPSIFGPLPV